MKTFIEYFIIGFVVLTAFAVGIMVVAALGFTLGFHGGIWVGGSPDAAVFSGVVFAVIMVLSTIMAIGCTFEDSKLSI